MKILVFGKGGQLSSELARRHSDRCSITAVGRDVANLLEPQKCAEIILASDTDVIINAAAYTAVDVAEEEAELVRAINATAPTVMAATAAKRNIPFLHVSTDYVFDGSGNTPWKESDAIAPINVYGQSKWEGEEGIRSIAGSHVILRTSWVFSSHGNNFVKTMLRLAQTHQSLSIVCDQVGGPTAAGDIADTLLTMATAMKEGHQGGTFHFSGAPDVSWADFAREIYMQSGQAVEVSDIPASSYPTPAQRPKNSRLDCSAIDGAFGISRPDWRLSLAKVLAELD